MNIEKMLADLKERGVSVEMREGKLKVKAPQGTIDPDLLETLRNNKDAIITALQGHANFSTHRPFKIFSDFPGGRTVIIETEEEWNSLVRYFERLYIWDQKMRKKIPQISSSCAEGKLAV